MARLLLHAKTVTAGETDKLGGAPAEPFPALLDDVFYGHYFRKRAYVLKLPFNFHFYAATKFRY